MYLLKRNRASVWHELISIIIHLSQNIPGSTNARGNMLNMMTKNFPKGRFSSFAGSF